MKTWKLIILASLALLIQSCKEEAHIQLQNKITQVELLEVKWGDRYMAWELLPGESSERFKLMEPDTKFPASHKVSFKMTANNKTIYLETDEEYRLDDGDDLLIILTDDTKVSNPNE